jgi:hypothetical protein
MEIKWPGTLPSIAISIREFCIIGVFVLGDDLVHGIYGDSCPTATCVLIFFFCIYIPIIAYRL